jgi:dolichyl-phosphate-mannose-protein mannosyltransferase
VLVVAILLRLYRLGSLPWEQDELYTLGDSRSLTGPSAGPGIAARPVYYVLHRAFLEIAPPTELWMRLPAALFGIAGVALTWWVVRREFGSAGALAAAGLLAIVPWHLYASQFARYWTLVYLLSLLLFWLYPRALDRDEPSGYRTVLLVAALGALTHPTFVFPAVGFMAAAHLIGPEGTARWRWPTGRAWRNLWIPLFIGVPLAIGALSRVVQGRVRADDAGAGVLGAVRPLLGMVEWATPAVVTASVLGSVYLIVRPDAAGDRRAGVMALAGYAAMVALIAVVAARASVYADYGMAGLPLLVVSIGGAAQRLCDRSASTWPALATLLILGSAVLPGTVSHLRDGTRFDFRPSFAEVAAQDPDGLLLIWPIIVQRTYAPELRAEEFRFDVAQLDHTLAEAGRFWIAAPYGRDGIVGDAGALESWTSAHCREVLRTSRSRLDYRVYRVELLRCGEG